MKLKIAERLEGAEMNAAIDDYIDTHSEPEPDYLSDVVRNTNLQMINPRMMSGHLQGRILKLLVEISGAKSIVELGAFSGYSALCMAEGLPDDGHLVSIEIDDENEDFIREQFALVPWGGKIELIIGDAMEVIPTLEQGFDLAFIDADKRLYRDFYEMLLPKMRKGGLILADNTLWDGKVLIEQPHANDYQTIAIKAFNDFITADPRVEKVILPLRDGLTLMRVK